MQPGGGIATFDFEKPAGEAMRYTIYYTTLLKKRMASMKCDHSPSIEEVTEYLVKQFGHKERDIAVTRILEMK